MRNIIEGCWISSSLGILNVPQMFLSFSELEIPSVFKEGGFWDLKAHCLSIQIFSGIIHLHLRSNTTWVYLNISLPKYSFHRNINITSSLISISLFQWCVSISLWNQSLLLVGTIQALFVVPVGAECLNLSRCPTYGACLFLFIGRVNQVHSNYRKCAYKNIQALNNLLQH